MQVRMINFTPNPERAIAEAAWTCYNADTSGFSEKTRDEIATFVRMLATLGHTSTFEHASFTWRIQDVSRALTHQLVRHRIASYSQQSQRYVEFDGGTVQFIYPPSIEGNMLLEYEMALVRAVQAYDNLIAGGVPKEDARYILPNATPSEIVVTMNARALLNFFGERRCARAQWEIRDLANQMYISCMAVAPALFEKAGPSCVTGSCNQGRMSCGNPIKPWSYSDV